MGRGVAYHAPEEAPTSQTKPSSTAPLPPGKPPPRRPPALGSWVWSSPLAAPSWAAQFLFLQGQCPPQAPGSRLPRAQSSPKASVLQPAELPEYRQCLRLPLQVRPPVLESSSARQAVPMAPWLRGPLAVGGVSVAPWYCQGAPGLGLGDITQPSGRAGKGHARPNPFLSELLASPGLHPRLAEFFLTHKGGCRSRDCQSESWGV